MAEIRQRGFLAVDLAVKFFCPLMRKFQKLVEKTELPDNVEGGRMDGVAAKIAKKITVFFQHRHIDALARQQIPQH